MVDVRNEIINLLMSTERNGITELVNHMSKHGFFNAPCSGKHHLSVSGGLAEHSLNVYTYMKDLAEAWDVDVDINSLILVSLLHDLGKMGDYGKPNYVENILTSGKRSDAEPYKTNKELIYEEHEIRSALIAQRYISLDEEETHAIIHHNGLWGKLDSSFSSSFDKHALSLLLHFADLWCSRIVEEGDEE